MDVYFERMTKKICPLSYTNMPGKEKWLFDNKQALSKVKQGIKDAAADRLYDKGSFAPFVDDDSNKQN